VEIDQKVEMSTAISCQLVTVKTTNA